jgi:hypothetical protein
MRIAIYRLLLSTSERPADVRPLLRFAVPVSASETIVEIEDLSGVKEGMYYLAVPVGLSAAVYFADAKVGQPEESLVWSDPVALHGSDSPTRPVVTPVGKIYWVQSEETNKEKPVPVTTTTTTTTTTPRPIVTTTTTTTTTAIADKPVAVVEVTVEDSTAEGDDELVEYLTPESFEELSTTEKRNYLREIGIDGPVDMRSNASMVEGYMDYLSSLEDPDE